MTKNSSPAFIWATMNDGAVPVENSFLMAKAYKENNVPFEFHVFEDGVHGLSTAEKETLYENIPVQKWLELSLTWLSNRGFKINK